MESSCWGPNEDTTVSFQGQEYWGELPTLVLNQKLPLEAILNIKAY